MSKSVKGTRTEQNLLKAFAGESQARTRYTFFASVAKKEGYEQIAGVFAETADQEKEHAKRFFKFLEGGDLEITASYPAGRIGTTAENLLAAAKGENEEWDVLYREFGKVAEEEGFTEIATAFKMIATVEAEHERRYLKLLSRPVNYLTYSVAARDGKEHDVEVYFEASPRWEGKKDIYLRSSFIVRARFRSADAGFLYNRGLFSVGQVVPEICG